MKAVKQLGHPAEAPAIVAVGVKRQGDGWTTGRASRKLHSCTGEPIVSQDFNDYKGSWLYALCVHWSLDISTVALSEKFAEAAYILADAFNAIKKPEENMQEENEDSNEDDEDVVFDWEEKLTDLP